MADQTLFVPVTVQAMVVNDQVRKEQNFQRWTMNYRNLESYASPAPPAFSGNASGWNNDPSANGVYLHWTVPPALRHGVQDSVSGTTSYPLVPNRWAVVRYSGPRHQRVADAWVVDSDFLDPNRGTSPFIDPRSPDRLSITCIGRKTAMGDWKETAEGGALFLTAVAPGNVTFAAFQPNCENVFSIHDPLDGVGDKGTLSYLVAGWYSDAAGDPLAQAKTLDDFAAILARLGWQVAGGADQVCTVSVYHGLVTGLAWDRTGPLPLSDRPTNPTAVTLAVGNTSIDALSALIDQQSGNEEYAKLLEAFQYDLLATLDKPNGPDLLDQAIHKAWFGSAKGGYEWVIVKDLDGSASKRNTDPVAPVVWSDPDLFPVWLGELNRAQSAYDAALQALLTLQWELYALWWTQGKFGQIPRANQQALRSMQPKFTNQGFAEELSARLAALQARTEQAAVLLAAIPHGDTDAALEASIKAYGTLHGLAAGYTLKRFAAPAFHQANEPVVFLAGTGASAPLTSDQDLTCRYRSALITGLTYDGKPVTVDDMKGTIPAPASLPAVHPGLVALLNEFFFLDPGDAAMIAETALGTDSEKTITALADQITAHKDETGVLPDLDLSPWRQPWSPLFLMWMTRYYPIPYATDGVANWCFNGQGYDLIDSHLPVAENDFFQLRGVALLTPQSSFNFKNRLTSYRNKHPDLDPEELKALEDFITATDDWDFLSQTLDGFSFQLTCRNPESNVTPGSAGTLAQLIGANNSPVPMPGSYPVPFDETWPKNDFQQFRSGQFLFERLMVVDQFGQSLEIITSETEQTATPIRAEGVKPARTVLDQEPGRFIQLSPRLLQPARLDFTFVSATDDQKPIDEHSTANPVCAWILPNHLDRSLACYDPAGGYLGELLVITDDQARKIVHWNGGPDGAYPTIDSLGAAFPHLKSMLGGLAAAGPDAFGAFSQVVDETLWLVDPLGSRDDRNLSVLVGRPLALVRAHVRYGLCGPAVANPSWEFVFGGYAPEFTGYTFPVRLGELNLRNDGLIGYFTGADYSRFNSVHRLSDADGVPYIAPIGKGNFIDLTFQAESEAYLSLLVDPRASVHATTAILPTAVLGIPSRFVEPALGAMDIVFQAGPVLSELLREPDGADSDTAVLIPQPAEQNGRWSWMGLDGTTWTRLGIRQTDQNARLSTTLPALRTGLLTLSNVKPGTH